MTIDKIKEFLELNGWKKDEIDEDYISYTHNDNYYIDVGIEDGEIVILADQGDIFHIPLTKDSIYTLVGFLFIHPIDYKKYRSYHFPTKGE